MPEVIVTFQNKKDPEFVTPPMQVPEEFKAEDMEKFLNTLLNHDKAYAFFHEGKQISALPKVSSNEGTINIEFLTVSKITSESAVIEMDSVITAISVRRNPSVHTDSIVICTAEGTTVEYSLAPGLDKLREFDSFKLIRGVTSTEHGIYVVTSTDKVVDVEKGEVVFESETPIRTISNCQGLLAIGLGSGEVVLLQETRPLKTIKASGEVGKVLLRVVAGQSSPVLIIGIVSGSIEVHNLSDWSSHTIKLPRPITAMGYDEGKIYSACIGGVIVVSTLSSIEKECQSDEPFISRIEAGTVFFGYSNENRVLIREKEDYTGTHLILLSSTISDMKISGKRLFVSEGNTLKLFNIYDE